MSDVYFFGCANHEAGHYLFTVQGRSIPYWEWNRTLPWVNIDGSLAPGGRGQASRDEIDGHAALHHKDGWTALAWWDRSVDKRGGCNAGLYARGTFTAEEMLAKGREAFPVIFARFKYTITTEARS